LPYVLDAADHAALQAGIEASPSKAAIAATARSWNGVRQLAAARLGKRLNLRRCRRSLHPLGFVWKRPKRRLDGAQPSAPPPWPQCRNLVRDAAAREARTFFVDDANSALAGT
jgi:hypothetical protein